MTRNSTKESGFSVVEGLLIVIVLLLSGFISFYVYHANDKTVSTYDASSNTAATPIVKTTPKNTAQQPSVVADKSTLAIKEWNVKVYVAAVDATTLMYTIKGPSSAQESTGNRGYAQIERTDTPADCKDAGVVVDRDTTQDNDKKQFKVGNYYYSFEYSGDCGKEAIGPQFTSTASLDDWKVVTQ